MRSHLTRIEWRGRNISCVSDVSILDAILRGLMKCKESLIQCEIGVYVVIEVKGAHIGGTCVRRSIGLFSFAHCNFQALKLICLNVIEQKRSNWNSASDSWKKMKTENKYCREPHRLSTAARYWFTPNRSKSVGYSILLTHNFKEDDLPGYAWRQVFRRLLE